ncbi:UPF0758 family protein [hydrothermal vent metagenome]|uniref:UPF0758 family protein n=1 Tax=hydrothermal vent metagenome TaxID=652676 RepID=A0A3B1D5N7_9ZZZZ
MNAEKPNDGHRERLRKKFLKFGLDKFTDDEIVELLLTLATPRKDCKQIARNVLKEFGSLKGVLEAPMGELQKIGGIGPNNALGIRLIHSIARKFLREKILKENYIDSFEEVLDYFTHALRDEKYEFFHVLFLNSQNAILHEERLAVGSATHVVLSPQQVIGKALSSKAAIIVLAHNHPGGSIEPSGEDVALTKEIVFSARLLDLSVREHLIISPNGYFSFMENGLMKIFDDEFERFHKRLVKLSPRK